MGRVRAPQMQLMQETEPTANLGPSFLSVESETEPHVSESHIDAALAAIMNILSVRKLNEDGC